jgi:hypothetical protein
MARHAGQVSTWRVTLRDVEADVCELTPNAEANRRPQHAGRLLVVDQASANS